MTETVKLMRNNAAIDAAILTKDRSIKSVKKYFKISLEKMAAIGDEVTDISLLKTPGLGMVGAPANAQLPVKNAVSNLPNSYVSSKRAFEGFMDFYQRASNLGIELIISDKDGVLKEDSESAVHSREFRKLALHMGQERNPYIIVLTGSSQKQNISFMNEYGLNEELRSNPKVVEYPFLVLIENGAIHLNVLTGEIKNYVKDICPEMLKMLKGEFEERVKKRLESEVFPELGLEWSLEYGDQNGKVYHSREKLSMVTFNVPRGFSDGRPYRKSPEADKYRDRTILIMQEEAVRLNLPYQILV